MEKIVPDGFKPTLDMVESLEESDEKFVALTKSGSKSYIKIIGEKSKDGTTMTFEYARKRNLNILSKMPSNSGVSSMCYC